MRQMAQLGHAEELRGSSSLSDLYRQRDVSSTVERSHKS